MLYVVVVDKYDVWWHLATGRWVIENGAVPHTDPFSYTAAGRPWHHVCWLGGVILYGWHSVFGDPGLTVLNAILAFGFIVFSGLTVRSLGARHPATALAVAVLVGFLVQSRLSILRPMVIGAVLLTACLWIIARWWSRGDRSIYLVVPIVAVWVPIHGASILSLGIVGWTAVAALLTAKPAPAVMRASLATALCGALMVATGEGRDILRVVFFGLDGNALAVQLTEEWKRFDPSERFVWSHYALWLLGVITALKKPRTRALALGWAFIGLRTADLDRDQASLARWYDRIAASPDDLMALRAEIERAVSANPDGRAVPTVVRAVEAKLGVSLGRPPPFPPHQKR